MSITRPVVSSIQYLKHRMKYGKAAPHPRQIIYVDPNKITHKLWPHLKDTEPVSKYKKEILGGSWDLAPKINKRWYNPNEISHDERVLLSLENYALYNSIREHLTEDVPWEDTDWFRYVKNNPGNLKGEYTNIELAYKQFEKVDRLFSDMQNSGYTKQSDLGESLIYPEYDEITVHIGRDGDLFKAPGGRHRLILAQILGFEKIPVYVHIRHKKWQKIRLAIRNMNHQSELNTDARQYLSHPDIISVRNTK